MKQSQISKQAFLFLLQDRSAYKGVGTKISGGKEKRKKDRKIAKKIPKIALLKG